MDRQFDFTTGPSKIFVESTNTAMMPGLLVTAFHSGEDTLVFAFQIHHAKQLARVLLKHIEEYEKQFGPVDGRLPTEPMPSPINLADGTGKGGSTNQT